MLTYTLNNQGPLFSLLKSFVSALEMSLKGGSIFNLGISGSIGPLSSTKSGVDRWCRWVHEGFLQDPRASIIQWLFLVPLIGGRWYIITQLAVYTTHIPLIVLANWVMIYHWSPHWGNHRNSYWIMVGDFDGHGWGRGHTQAISSYGVCFFGGELNKMGPKNQLQYKQVPITAQK